MRVSDHPWGMVQPVFALQDSLLNVMQTLGDMHRALMQMDFVDKQRGQDFLEHVWRGAYDKLLWFWHWQVQHMGPSPCW